MEGKHFGTERPSDFREFWAQALTELDDWVPEIRIEKWGQEDPNGEDEYILDDQTGRQPLLPRQVNPFDFRWSTHVILAGCSVFRVTFSSWDGQEVGGLLQVPRFSGKGPFPGIVHFAGYGGEVLLDADFVTNGYAVFNFSHRGMLFGCRGFDRYAPVPLLVRGIETPETNVYRSIVMDCLLAIKVLRGHGLVDPGRMGVMGTSQGAALALIASVLDDRVKVAACDLPWLTDFGVHLSRCGEGPSLELVEFLKRFPEKADAVRRTLGYFDTLSFAEDVKRPILISLGKTDGVAPPDTVRTLFERIEAIKSLLEIPGMGHERSTLFRYMARQWFGFFL